MSGKSGQSRSRKSSVVVEIGREWLKVLEADRAGRGVAVSRLHLERISDSAAGLGQALQTAVNDLKFSRTDVVVCLPRDLVNVRIIKLPSTDPSEIADMIELQVGKQTPYSRDQIIWDYKILGAEKEGYARVMLVIAQRSVVRQRVNVVEEAGLDVGTVSVTSEGVLGWFLESGFDQRNGRGVALADVDASYTDLIVCAGGGAVFSRSIKTGATHLTDEYGAWIDRFAGEIRQSLEICRSEVPGLEIDRLLVSGAGPAIEGLTADLGQRLEIAAEPADSVQKATRMPKAPSIKDPLYRVVSITPLIGTALDSAGLDFDLMPESVALRKRLIDRSKAMTIFGILLITATVSLSLLANMKVLFRKHHLERLASYAASVEPDVEEVIRKHQIIKIVRGAEDRELSCVNVFAEIQKIRPEDVYLTEVEIDSDRMRVAISGTGGTLADVRAFLNGLKSAGSFTDVKPGGTTLERDARYSFEVACALEK